MNLKFARTYISEEPIIMLRMSKIRLAELQSSPIRNTNQVSLKIVVHIIFKKKGNFSEDLELIHEFVVIGQENFDKINYF